MAVKLEIYYCQNCKKNFEMPKYNDPLMLYETKFGACSEHGKAFTALCVASGLDCRLVVDYMDHTWTEVYYEDEKRWV